MLVCRRLLACRVILRAPAGPSACPAVTRRIPSRYAPPLVDSPRAQAETKLASAKKAEASQKAAVVKQIGEVKASKKGLAKDKEARAKVRNGTR